MKTGFRDCCTPIVIKWIVQIIKDYQKKDKNKHKTKQWNRDKINYCRKFRKDKN